MNTIIMIIGVVFFFIIVHFLFFALLYIFYFHMHQCKYCGHHMEYKGLKEDNNGGHYLFHCPKCGAWEEVPKEIFINKFFKDINSYKQSYDIK